MSTSRLDRAANWAIILTALMAVTVFISRASGVGPFGTPESGAPPPIYEVGDPVEVPNARFESARQTLLMVMDSNCRYCTESMPFYRRLLEANAKGAAGTRTVAIGTEPVETIQAYLRSHGVTIEAIADAEKQLKVAGTPTLLLVDNAGRVSQMWRGRLSEAGERDVFSRVVGSPDSVVAQ